MSLTHLQQKIQYHRHAALLSLTIGQTVRPHHIKGYENLRGLCLSDVELPEDVKESLQTQADTFNLNANGAVKGPLDVLDSEKESLSTKSAWKAQIEQQREASIQKAKAAIIAAYDGLYENVEALPEHLRTSATNLGLGAFQIVENWMVNIGQYFSGLLSSIANFLKGVYAALEKAFETVKNVVTSAFSAIGNLFK